MRLNRRRLRRESFSGRVPWLRGFLASHGIRRWLDGAFPVLTAGFGRGVFSTLGRKALEAGEQHGVQSVAALRGNRMKGKKRKHG